MSINEVLIKASKTAKERDALKARVAELEKDHAEMLAALDESRIALNYYAVWMRDHCPEGNGSTRYPFGEAAAKSARAVIAETKETAK